MILPLLLLACGRGPLPPTAPPPAELRLEVKQTRLESGDSLTLHRWTAPGWTLPLPTPSAPGLELLPTPSQAPLLENGRSREDTVWTLAGAPGSYVVSLPSTEAIGPGGERLRLPEQNVFIDLGVTGPAVDEMAGLEIAPEPRPFPVAALVGALGVTALIVGAFIGFRRRKPALAAPLSPEALARRSWQQARIGEAHAQAFALSRVLRSVLENRLNFQANAATPRELRVVLGQSPLDETGQAGAMRILEATDRLKFAREGGGDGFFEAMDADFELVLRQLYPIAPPGSPHG